MKKISRLFGLSLVVVALSGFTAADALGANLVSGSIGASGSTCSWTNGTTNNNPPTTLTIENSSINPPGGNLSCSGGNVSSATLVNDPQVSFNDGAGTASSPSIQVSVVAFGVTCGYTASNVTLNRVGSSRQYTGSATATKTSGGFFCPGSQTINADITFH